MQKILPHEKGLLVLFALFVTLSIMYIVSEHNWIEKQKIDAQKETTIIGQTFDAYSGEAQAFSIYDSTTTQFLYEKNGTVVRPLASVTKIMTAITALQIIKPGNNITIPLASLVPEGDNGLLAGEKWKIDDLVSFMLINSSNDAALALALRTGEKLQVVNNIDGTALRVFLDAMNEKAKRLGLMSLHFESPNGLDDGINVPTVMGSSHDVALLLSFAVQAFPEVFKKTNHEKMTFVSESGITHLIENTNKAVGKIPSLLASKTGYTESAQGNLAIAYTTPKGHTIIITVLGSSKNGRFSDVEKLVETTNQYFSLK